MEKEIPKDLTMLQPSEDDKAFESLIKNPPKRAGAFGSPSTPDEAKKYVQGLQEDYLQAASMHEGKVDLGLDGNRSMFEDTNAARARNQSWGVKGIKAIGGGILQGALIAAEQLGYVGDLEGMYQRLLGEPDGISGNWWSDLMKETQDNLRESNAFKIYEDNPDENSLASQIFKWTSLEGAVSSAVGFGLTGLGAAKLVSTLGSLGKFKELAAFTDAAMGNIKGGAKLAEATKAGAGMTGATQAFAGPLATSAMSNYFMGQMMATDTYNQIMEGLAPMIESGKMSKLEAQKVAANEAQDVVGLNMALTATAYIKFGGIFKRAGRVKGLVENPTALNQIKNLIKAGSPTAFTENVYQEMIQMEQIHDTAKTFGQDSPYSDDYWSRMTQLALSNRAMHAGALGIVGGPIQFAVIQRPMMGRQIKEQRELYTRQQASKKWQEALVKNYYDTFEKYDKMSKEALIAGKPQEAKFIEDIHNITELSKSVENGTLSILKKDIKDIIASKEKPEGYDDNYKEVGQTFLDDINQAESYIMEYGGLANRAEVIQNIMIHDRTLKEVLSLRKDSVAKAESVLTGIKDALGIDVIVNNKGKFEAIRDSNRFDSLTESKKAVVLKQEETENQKLADYLNYNKDYKDFIKLTDALKRHEKFRQKVYDKHEYLISDKGQKDFEESTNKAIEEYEDNVNNEVEAQKQVEADTQVQESKLDEFKKVRDQAPKLSENELENLRKQWDDEVGNNKNRVLESSFTSRDDLGEIRIFTPGELLRSDDGRYFKVQNQVGAGSKENKGKIKYQAKALVKQTDENGKMIKGTKPVILDEHTFLRDESLLPFIKRDGTVANNYPKDRRWGTYIKSDSILKPNDVEYQLSLVKRAANGEVAGINIMADLLLRGDYKWLEKYNHHLLNLPFKEPYDVVYKVRKEGEYEVYVDVYKREAGKKDLLLTRINKNANINYKALIELITLNKGEVTGKAVGHYSNKYNLVKHFDQEGNKLYSDIKEMKSMTDYLINGQIILAQTKGENHYPTVDVARAADGTVYADGYIEVDGKPLTIPFNDSMDVGDTYALILSPRGEIVPIALSAHKLIDMPSQLEGGNSFTDDVVAEWKTAIKTWLKEELENEDVEDEKLHKLVNNDPDVGDKFKDEVFAERKAKRLWAKIKTQKEKNDKDNSQDANFKKTIYKHIRANYTKYKILGEKNNKDVFETRLVKGKKVKVVRANYFNPTVAVSKNTGKFVPAIRVRNPYNFTLETTYNLEDNPKEFYKILGNQRKRASINTLSDQSIKGKEAKALMQDFINNEGLKVDIDVSTPFLGSSGSFTVDGSDFLTMSNKAALSKEKRLASSFPKLIKELETPITIESSKEIIDTFSEDLDDTFSEDSTWLASVNESQSEDEVKDNFIDLIHTFKLNQEAGVIKMINQFYNEVPSEFETQYTQEIKNIKDKGFSDNAEAIAKGMLMIHHIRTEVEQGNITLKSKNRIKSTEDPTGKYTQPEGLKFEFGTKVYHSDYGEATFKTKLNNEKYKLTLKSGKEVTVFPGDTYLISGERAELYKTIKELGRTEESSPRYKVLTNIKNRLEARITSDTVKKLKTTPEDSDTSIENILEDQFISMGAHDVIISKLKGYGSTERTRNIVEKLKGFSSLKDITDDKESEQLTNEELETINSTFKNIIPYSISELDSLINLAERQVENNVDVPNAKKAISDFKSIRTLLKVIDVYVPQPSPYILNMELYAKSADKVHEKKVMYLGQKTTNSTILGGDIGYQLDALMGTIQRAIVGESALRQTMFVVKESTPKPVSTTAKKETEKPQQKFTVKVDLNRKSSETVLSDEQAIILRDKFKAPTEVLNRIESGAYSVLDLSELFKTLEVLKASGLPYNDAFDEFINKAKKEYPDSKVPFKRGEDTTNTQEKFDEEVKKVKKLLPQVPLEVVENVTAMVNKYGLKAIGSYDSGVQYIVNRAKEGTVFHEAFHAVSDLYLKDDEKLAIAKEHGQNIWNINLEEKLAEMFEKYVNKKPLTLGEKVKKFFASIMNWFKGTRSLDITEKIFDRIVSKGYAKTQSLSWRDRVSPLFNSIEQYKTNISKENSVLLQSLLDANKIEIIC